MPNMTSRFILTICAFSSALSGCADMGDSGAAGSTNGTGNGRALDRCANGIMALSGTYDEDITIGPSVCGAFLLIGGVFIGEDAGNSGVTLTIEPGTTIYGDPASGGFLSVQQGSFIEANGTADAPIVFTSAQAVGNRARSDWGGIILNGKAPINNCSDGGGEVAGCTAQAEGDAGTYGGDDPADSSGSLQYVRIEFGGSEISPENEVNGLALQGVGSGTTLSHIQVHMNKDDGIEFFGGTVNADHLVITGAGDDSLDWTDGWSGTVSHVCIEQYDDGGDRGIEADNNSNENNALPRSAPSISYVSLVGAGTDRTGMTLREGTAVSLSHIAAAGFDQGCLDIDDTAAHAQLDAGALTITNSVLGCGENNFKVDTTDTGAVEEPADEAIGAWWSDQGNDTMRTLTFSGFEANVDGVGCIPDGDDWTAGWTTTDTYR
jgi:hypothetical protein